MRAQRMLFVALLLFVALGLAYVVATGVLQR
jgi:hypothetical protein